MNVQIHPSFADLTTPLLSPDILGSFEALAEGRCSLSELNDSVLEACRSDPNVTEGVLLLLESYANSAEFERFDLGPLKRALERGRDEIDDASTQAFTERDDQSADVPVLAPMDEPRMLRGRYILEAEIGRGGVGTVYRALDLNRGGLPPEHRHVALKILGENAARRPDAVDALRREYHQAQSLSHPGIVNVFDFDHDGDTYFVTMELLDGESLGELTRRLLPNKLPLEAATRILRELGDAIVYAHGRGILHLDLKPDNVMVDADGHVRVLDFGIAQTQIAEPRIPQMRSAPPAATPAYASCERLVQERPDVRDDIFSFSCITYELLVGRHPFDRSSALTARKDGRKARRSRDLSRRQWAALESGLAWAREDRPANMRELLQGLALHSSAPAGTSTRRVTWHRAAAVALVMLGSAALLNWARIQDRAREGADERVVRGHDEGPASPVDTQPVSEEGADDVSRRTPDALAATTLSPQTELDTAAPSTPDPTFEIESAGAVARPASLPADAQGETSDRDPNAVPTRSFSAPREVSAAGKALAAAPRATAAPVDVLGFSRHSFSVSEADSVVHLNVRRLGAATGDIAFQWYTVDESARAGQDYVYGFGEVLMAPGQTTATFDVPIVTDTIREDPELLQVIIGSSRGAHVGAAGRAPVIIVDDD
jgi:serine/threonine protein kinase